MPLERARVVRLRTLSLVAVVFFAVHCGRFAFTGEAARVLWLSNVATLVLGVGCAVNNRHLTALAFAWLSFSAVLWFVDVGFGEMAVDTSVLTHLGSFALAIGAVAVLGIPKNTWLRAAFGLALLVLVSRFFTKREQNINLAYTVADGWRGSFSNHGAYLLLLLAASVSVFFAAEWFGRRGIRLRGSGALPTEAGPAPDKRGQSDG